jgi:hypothetical protein
MKKHLTDTEIKKLFADPYSLRKTIKLWKDAEKGGMEFVRNVKEERKKLFEKTIK